MLKILQLSVNFVFVEYYYATCIRSCNYLKTFYLMPINYVLVFCSSIWFIGGGGVRVKGGILKILANFN